MKRGGGRKSAGSTELEFAALRAFFSAYLHQDFHEEYGSAAGATVAFCKDARPEEIASVRNEWDAWRKHLGNASATEVAAAIRKLGGAWQPQAVDDLDSVRTFLKSSGNPSC